MNEAQLTIATRDNGAVTFLARWFDGSPNVVSTAIDAGFPMLVDRVHIDPSSHSGDSKKACGVSLEYRQSSEYDTQMAHMFVISPEDERRLVSWLHEHGCNFVIETSEWKSASLQDAAHRGRCAGCGEAMDGGASDWTVTLHRDDDHDLHYCSTRCFDQ